MKKFTALTAFTLIIGVSIAQQVSELNEERLVGVSTLTIKLFNGGGVEKGFKEKYHFNDQGLATSAKFFFKHQKRSVYEYEYDHMGNPKYSIQTFSINDKSRIDSTVSIFEYDSKKRPIKKMYYTSSHENVYSEIYSNFNQFDKPNKKTYISSQGDTSTHILEYNQNGLITKIQYLRNDSLETKEVRRYNENGDLCYSLIPSLIGKEDEQFAIFVSGNRYAPEEHYEYNYDNQNRWTEKYLVYKDNKVLLYTRKYR